MGIKKNGWLNKFTKQMIKEEADDANGTAIQLLAFFALRLLMLPGLLYVDFLSSVKSANNDK